jgi:hypothetical protein
MMAKGFSQKMEKGAVFHNIPDRDVSVVTFTFTNICGGG